MGAPNKRYNESRSYRLVIILYELFALLNLSKHAIKTFLSQPVDNTGA